MKKLFRATTALTAVTAINSAGAADMPVKAPPPVYSWTGLYVGGQVGGGWASSSLIHDSGSATFPQGFVDNAISDSGVLGGAYAGYNYQINPFLIGIDDDCSFANLTGSGTSVSPSGTGVENYSNRIEWTDTLAGRLGYTNNNWLFFGRGGWAWAGFSQSSQVTHSGALFSTTTSAQTRNGWTLGTGVEWDFAAHWSAKLEYDYVNFNTSHSYQTEVYVSGAPTAYPARSFTSYMSMVKLGVGYRF